MPRPLYITRHVVLLGWLFKFVITHCLVLQILCQSFFSQCYVNIDSAFNGISKVIGLVGYGYNDEVLAHAVIYIVTAVAIAVVWKQP